jgi:hypothetical protein
MDSANIAKKLTDRLWVIVEVMAGSEIRAAHARVKTYGSEA